MPGCPRPVLLAPGQDTQQVVRLGQTAHVAGRDASQSSLKMALGALPFAAALMHDPELVFNAGQRVRAGQGGGRPIPQLEVPDLEAKLAGLQSPRGWGLFLIEKMVDEMRVTSDETHHTIELVMHLEGEAS